MHEGSLSLDVCDELHVRYHAGLGGVSCGVLGRMWLADYAVEQLWFVRRYGYVLLFGHVFGWRLHGHDYVFVECAV